jgi:hypothetical protein
VSYCHVRHWRFKIRAAGDRPKWVFFSTLLKKEEHVPYSATTTSLRRRTSSRIVAAEWAKPNKSIAHTTSPPSRPWNQRHRFLGFSSTIVAAHPPSPPPPTISALPLPPPPTVPSFFLSLAFGVQLILRRRRIWPSPQLIGRHHLHHADPPFTAHIWPSPPPPPCPCPPPHVLGTWRPIALPNRVQKKQPGRPSHLVFQFLLTPIHVIARGATGG